MVQLGVHAALSRRRSRVQIPSGPPNTLTGVRCRVAQLVEHTPEKRGVTGSTPVSTTNRWLPWSSPESWQSSRLVTPWCNCCPMDFWAEVKRLSYVTDAEKFGKLVSALFPHLGLGGTPEQFRDLYRKNLCHKDGWPKSFDVLDHGKVEEGLTVLSLSGVVEGRTTGNRRKCLVTECPGWFIEVIWETGQRMWPCSEGWHFDSDSKTVSIIGGGEISARFITPKPLGTNPAPRNTWPTRSELARKRGWRVRGK